MSLLMKKNILTEEEARFYIAECVKKKFFECFCYFKLDLSC